jgi:erythromycin esterase-like protein
MFPPKFHEQLLHTPLSVRLQTRYHHFATYELQPHADAAANPAFEEAEKQQQQQQVDHLPCDSSERMQVGENVMCARQGRLRSTKMFLGAPKKHSRERMMMLLMTMSMATLSKHEHMLEVRSTSHYETS